MGRQKKIKPILWKDFLQFSHATLLGLGLDGKIVSTVYIN